MDVLSLAGPALESLFKRLLIMVLVSGLVCEIYNLCHPRHGVYYKPFGRQEPVIIRSPDALEELSEASELSQRAVYADIFGFKYMLSHTETEWDPNEQINQRYRLFTRAIRIAGVSQMKILQPYLQARMKKTFQEMVYSQVTTTESWTSIQVAPVMRDLATGMLGMYFFGEKLCQEPIFASAMSRYYDNTVTCMGAMQILPAILQPFAHSMITSKGHALKILFERLSQAADSKQDGWREDETLKSVPGISSHGSAQLLIRFESLVIQAIIGTWFAASHQPWINLHFVFLELCARPEYTDMIHNEIQDLENLDYESINSLPILDSFIKESQRDFLNILTVGIRRKALRPFKFSNGGPHVPVGKIACVSAWEIMHNEAKYPLADTFDGLRFIKAKDKTESGSAGTSLRGTKFTDASKDFPIWGLGSKVCPGRYHSALVIKMALVHLIAEYEFRLQDEPTSYRWFWETFQMPYELSKVLIRKRQQEKDMTA
ncbi:MAG: hypothetical protein ASARMPREDX12_006647 [Alectoria sarmentosa]|nr:MAG: hypothetical protein ASARMPREDX12_006647 [Alectoria sarmentosa]